MALELLRSSKMYNISTEWDSREFIISLRKVNQGKNDKGALLRYLLEDFASHLERIGNDALVVD